MTTMFKVTDPKTGATVMLAPLDIVARVFDLREGAVERILSEARAGGVCDIHFNYGRTKIGFAAVNVEVVS